jgi:hypothetical protein
VGDDAMTYENVTIAGQLVRYLRRGVKRELAASLVALAIEVERNVDPKSYYDALRRFEAANSLLDAIGLSDEPHPPSVELDLGRWPRLILKALEHAHDSEMVRIHDAQAAGINVPAPDTAALSELIAEIRSKVGLATRRKKRWRIWRAREQGVQGGWSGRR